MILTFLTKILFWILPFIILFIIYYLINKLANLINIRNYHYYGSDYLGNDVKINWFNASNKREESVNYKKVKYTNKYYYFQILIKRFKIGMQEYKEIDIKDKSSYNRVLVITINKDDISTFDKLKLIFWLLKQYFRNIFSKIIDSNITKRELPNFLVKTYILPNSLLLNEKELR